MNRRIRYVQSLNAVRSRQALVILSCRGTSARLLSRFQTREIFSVGKNNGLEDLTADWRVKSGKHRAGE